MENTIEITERPVIVGYVARLAVLAMKFALVLRRCRVPRTTKLEPRAYQTKLQRLVRFNVNDNYVKVFGNKGKN